MDSDERTELADKIADAIIFAAKHLGLNNACTPMGAIEAHAAMLKEAAQTIADAINNLAEAVREHTP